MLGVKRAGNVFPMARPGERASGHGGPDVASLVPEGGREKSMRLANLVPCVVAGM